MSAFGNARLDHAPADLHLEAVNRGARGAGEHVDRFERRGAGVDVELGHRDVGDHAGDVDACRGLLQRQGFDADGISAVDDEVRRQRARVIFGLGKNG